MSVSDVAAESPGPAHRITLREALRNPVVCALVTAFLLALCTQGLIALRGLTGERPYTILYLVPVAIGGALLGMRGGLVSALIAVVLARVYLFNEGHSGGLSLISLPQLPDDIEFASLAVGTLVIGLVTGRLRTVLGHLRRSNLRLKRSKEVLEKMNRELTETHDQLIDSEEQRQAFNRDVLLAVTGGKLRLIEPDEMPPSDLISGPPLRTMPLLEPQDASLLRRDLQALALESGMTPERADDLCTSATEAATNAIKHGGGGAARIWVRPDSLVVEVVDHGEGIAPAQLARATLEPGYSSRVSLGMGFFLMLQTSDTLALCTTPRGTALLLLVSKQPRPSDKDALLARYASL